MGRLRRTATLGILLGAVVVAGCLSSKVPDTSSILLLNGPERIPLRVGLQFDRIEGGTAQLATTYSRRGGPGRGAIEIGDPIGQTLLEGFDRIFLEVRPITGTEKDDDLDLLIRPGYRIHGNSSRGQYRSMNAVIDLEVSDQFGKEATIETGIIGGSSEGPFRSWKGYVAIPFWIFGLTWLELDSWSQAVASLGKNAVQVLDIRLRVAPIVLEAVKRKERLNSFELGELAENGLAPVFERFTKEMLNVPGRRVPVSMAIGRVRVQNGITTQWEPFVEEMLWAAFPPPLDKKLVKRRKANKTLAQLEDDGIDWFQQGSAIRYSSALGVEAVLLVSTAHDGDQLAIHGKLVEGRTGEDLHSSSFRILKSWRPTVIPVVK